MNEAGVSPHVCGHSLLSPALNRRYPSLLGIKVINLATNQVSAVLGEAMLRCLGLTQACMYRRTHFEGQRIDIHVESLAILREQHLCVLSSASQAKWRTQSAFCVSRCIKALPTRKLG